MAAPACPERHACRFHFSGNLRYHFYGLAVSFLRQGWYIAAVISKHIWFATVPPVDEERAADYGYTITNNQIAWYNYIVTSSLPPGVGVIDSYNYLAGRGIESDDGLHYRESTYLDWFAYIINNAY